MEGKDGPRKYNGRAAYFDELAEDDEIVPTKPPGTSLPKWEDLEEGEPRVDIAAFTLTGGPRKGRQNKQGNKWTRRESDRPGKVQLVDGRTTYLL